MLRERAEEEAQPAIRGQPPEMVTGRQGAKTAYFAGFVEELLEQVLWPQRFTVGEADRTNPGPGQMGEGGGGRPVAPRTKALAWSRRRGARVASGVSCNS